MERDWLLSEIATGLQKLLVLSLERSPASELIAGTACAWHEALTLGADWTEERDAPRIRQAFRVLAATRQTWPAPRHLIEALPRHDAQRALPKPPPDPEVAARHLEQIRKELGLSLTEAQHLGESGLRKAGEGLVDVEQSLREHYGVDRKAAAAGPDA